ncbi:hypothetical protein BSG1_12841 [Bacillus sp. SG-1]|nr:hypothetical protein BSG1_12841 [Bacillus sp. SG-1]
MFQFIVNGWTIFLYDIKKGKNKWYVWENEAYAPNIHIYARVMQEGARETAQCARLTVKVLIV